LRDDFLIDDKFFLQNSKRIGFGETGQTYAFWPVVVGVNLNGENIKYFRLQIRNGTNIDASC
jgi:hypothetical protein